MEQLWLIQHREVPGMFHHLYLGNPHPPTQHLALGRVHDVIMAAKDAQGRHADLA